MLAGRIVQQWKAPMVSHFDRYTGSSWGSASQICCSRRGRQGPNCIDGGATFLLVDMLKAGVFWIEGRRSNSPSGGEAVESQINRSFQLVWGVLARREIQRRRPKSKMDASAVRRMLKPQETRSESSAQHKAVEAGLRVDVCVPLRMTVQMVYRDQGFPTVYGNSEDARYWRSGVTRC